MGNSSRQSNRHRQWVVQHAIVQLLHTATQALLHVPQRADKGGRVAAIETQWIEAALAQLTDGIASLLRREKVFAYRYAGRRYDCGSKEGWLQANVELALAHPQLGPGFRDYLRGLEL